MCARMCVSSQMPDSSQEPALCFHHVGPWDSAPQARSPKLPNHGSSLVPSLTRRELISVTRPNTLTMICDDPVPARAPREGHGVQERTTRCRGTPQAATLSLKTSLDRYYTTMSQDKHPEVTVGVQTVHGLTVNLHCGKE